MQDVNEFLINLTDLGHEAGVWEAQEAASEEHDALAGGDEASLPRLGLPDGRGGREVEQHQEVSHHARHQPHHQDRLPPLLGRDAADESEYDATCNGDGELQLHGLHHIIIRRPKRQARNVFMMMRIFWILGVSD